MSYPSGSYPSGASASGGYHPGSWSPDPDDRPKLSHRHLMLAVALLGFTSYLVSFGPMLSAPGMGWEVRFALAAGLLAAFAMLAKQTPAGVVVAALAALGFLDAASTVTTAPDGVEPGWALWVVAVLNGMQTLAAVGALRAQPAVVDEQQAWYAAYAEQYAQAAAQYYGQYGQEAPPATEQQWGSGQSEQVQQVTAPEARRATAPQEASYAEFVGHAPAPTGGQVSEAQAVPQSSGLPSAVHSPAPAQQHAAPAQPDYRTAPGVS